MGSKSKHPAAFRYDFGGPIGAFAIVTCLPTLLNILALTCNSTSGCPAPALLSPHTLSLSTLAAQVNWPGISGLVTVRATLATLAWHLLQLVLYRVLPAAHVPGTELTCGGKHVYRLNAFGTTACILAVCLAGTLAQGAEFGFWVFVSENYLQILNAHLLLSYLLAGYTYLGSFSVKPKNKEKRELAEGGDSGNMIYDYWIGRELNPRATLPFIGEVDIKEYVEMRPGLLGWLILDLAFVAKQYRNFGYLSNSIVLVTAMQALYVLDSQYREPLVLTTMDITTDGFGFMLCFGNLSWVPFLYSTQTRYLSTYPLQLSNFNLFLITVVLVVGMAIFRLSNSQKNAFRTNPSDPSVAHLKYMKTKTGSKLLISGWWGLARHINYFGDWLQAWAYSLPTGWAGYLILPAGSMADGAVRMLDGQEVVSGPAKYWGMLVTYFYILYFGVLLIHREGRDDEECAKKYGEDWKKYKSIVPWKILPGVY